MAFRYVLNLVSFWVDSTVPFDRFKYVALCGRASNNQIFPHGLPCIITASYWKKEEKDELRFHPKCLHNYSPPPIDCDWLQEVEYDKTQFIALLLKEKMTHWCAKCETLLYEIGTVAFMRCVRRKVVSSTASNFFPPSHGITLHGSLAPLGTHVTIKKRCLYVFIN